MDTKPKFKRWDFIEWRSLTGITYKGLVVNEQHRPKVLWDTGVIADKWTRVHESKITTPFDLTDIFLDKYNLGFFLDNLSIIEIINEYREYLNGKNS